MFYSEKVDNVNFMHKNIIDEYQIDPDLVAFKTFSLI